jgi:LAO/AO transport system kinase
MTESSFSIQPASVQPVSVDKLSKRNLARLISGIENEDPTALRIARDSYLRAGRAHSVGITGAPGSGKSTLVSALTQTARKRGHRVAILSIDPSSTFSGGAILGDRIRMRDLSGDAGVFIRSMASRGALGGLASATADVAALLDVAGYDLIFVETVGAGQADIDVRRVADSVVVVEAPGLGDDVQAIKAGILEIADVLVVNKADRPGVEATVAALRAAMELGEATRGHHGLNTRFTSRSEDGATTNAWHTPILQTIATQGQGIDAVLDALARHRELQQAGGMTAERIHQVEQDVLLRLRDLAFQQQLRRLSPNRLAELVDLCAQRRMHPADAAQQLFDSAQTPNHT